MNKKPVRDLVQDIFAEFLKNLLTIPHNELVIFASEFTETSEKEFPTGTVALRAMRTLNSDRLTFDRVLVDQQTGEVRGAMEGPDGD